MTTFESVFTIINRLSVLCDTPYEKFEGFKLLPVADRS